MGKITFGICTYNRKDILSKSISSLKLVNNIENINIRIYDDCSTDYTEDYLYSLFDTQNNVTVHRNKHRKYADHNILCMYEDFLKSDDEWFFNADSDLIYSKDILTAIDNIKQKCKFCSLFNAYNHKVLGEHGDFVLKRNVGSAGCLISRDIVKLFIDDTKKHIDGVGVDYAFCDCLRNYGVDILATKKSYVQHIGLEGQNSFMNNRSFKFDYGMNFECDSVQNGIFIEETFEKYHKDVEKYNITTSPILKLCAKRLFLHMKLYMKTILKRFASILGLRI